MALLRALFGQPALRAVPSPTVGCAELLNAFWNAMDEFDADAVASQFAEQGCCSFGADRAVHGTTAIRSAFVRLFVELNSIHHRPITKWHQNGLLVADADLSVVFESGGRAVLPVTTVLWTAKSRITECRLLFYPEPALARAIARAQDYAPASSSNCKGPKSRPVRLAHSTERGQA